MANESDRDLGLIAAGIDEDGQPAHGGEPIENPQPAEDPPGGDPLSEPHPDEPGVRSDGEAGPAENPGV